MGPGDSSHPSPFLGRGVNLLVPQGTVVGGGEGCVGEGRGDKGDRGHCGH